MGELKSPQSVARPGGRAGTKQTIAARMVVPFVRELAKDPGVVPDLACLSSRDPDDRLALDEVEAILRPVIERTGQFAIGLKAGRNIRRKDADALYYAMSSAPTLAAALTIAGRYFRLLNDTVAMQVQRNGDHAFVRFSSSRSLTRVAADFLLAAMFYAHFRAQLSDLTRMEVWVGHAQPAYAQEYTTTFAPAQVLYGAECYGFRFPSRDLDAPLQGSDQNLHHVLRQHMDHVLSQMAPAYQSFTDKVSAVLTKELSQGANVTAVAVARAFRMSPRTLARRLESEGTTFSDLLDGLRHHLAVEYMARTSMSQAEVAFLLGFSHVAAFHRAFKRWTGQTPRSYRLQTGQAGGPGGQQQSSS